MDEVAAPNPYEAPRAGVEGEVPTGDISWNELQAFAGPRALVFWRRSGGGRARGLWPSWLWPAALFALLWFAYRKLWREGLVLLGAETAYNLLEPVVSRLLGRETLLGLWTLLVEFVILGLLGVPLYMRRARLEIARARATFPGDPARQTLHLTSAGGTNGWWVLVAIAVSVAGAEIQGGMMRRLLNLLS